LRQEILEIAKEIGAGANDIAYENGICLDDGLLWRSGHRAGTGTRRDWKSDHPNQQRKRDQQLKKFFHLNVLPGFGATRFASRYG
jgi:hypothetical protein